MNKAVTLSVVIPVKNGVATLGHCLEGIYRQSLFAECEIIVIDSGSTDGTLELLRQHPQVRLHQIPPEQFNHGATRNLGVELAQGKFVIMTVQDAVAADEFWLENLRRHFSDPQVAGVCGKQEVARQAHTNPHEWSRPVSAPKSRKISFTAQAFECLSPKEKKAACSWDDVNAMYRKEILQKVPFRKVTFGEDMIWAADALMADHTLVYEPKAVVHHYHQVDYDYQYRRSLTVFYFLYRFFGLKPSVQEGWQETLKVVYRNFRWGAPLRWIRYNLQKRAATLEAQRHFGQALQEGDAALDALHEKFCGKAPQAKANKV